MNNGPNVQSPSRARSIAAWAVQILLAAAFLAAGGAKLAGAQIMVQLFDQIGFGQWFRLVTGGVEVVGALALLIPGFAVIGAAWLGFTMLCAVLTHLFLLHTSPAPAVVLLAVNLLAIWLRREELTAAAAKIEFALERRPS